MDDPLCAEEVAYLVVDAAYVHVGGASLKRSCRPCGSGRM